MSYVRLLALCAALLMLAPEDGYAIGGRGGGGGGGRGGGGFSRGGGGGGARPQVSRPQASRPQVSRPNVSAPNLGASRPNINRPTSRPNVNLPQSRPNISPPSSRPNFERPNGGLNPSNRPTTLPGNINRPNFGSRPNTSLPNFGGGNRPGGGDRPNLGNLPGGGNRPGGGDRPNLGNLPGAGNRPDGGRPSAGDLGDFLGLDKPIRPDGGLPNFPNRPGGGDRPGNRPGIGDRPGPGNRPGIGDRPIGNDIANIGNRNRWSNNAVINKRPTWANINNSTNININNRWNNAIVNPARPGWQRPPANRMGYWNGWGNGVRDSWRYYNHHNNWFTNSWWGNHRYPACGWHYHYRFNRYPYGYWWRVPTWAALTDWFIWTAPRDVWSQPVYYDYGSGGNVVYQDNSVYVGGTEVASADDFAASAMDLATVPPPDSEQQAEAAEWMPLGTFAVSTNEQDTQPSQVIQLAVSKEGIISGTLYNIETDQVQAVQGKVDEKTQRVAFRVGDSQDVVFETGLYNLTENEVPVLVHFGAEKTEEYLLVRMDEPEQQDGDASGGDALNNGNSQ